MKLYLFFIFIFFHIKKNIPSDTLNTMKAILSIINSYSATPSEKNKLESIINSLENQTQTLEKNAETQKENILILSSFLDKLILEMQWFETFNKMIINIKIQNITKIYSNVKKSLLDAADLAEKSKFTNLIKILLFFIKNFYKEYFTLLNQYAILLKEDNTKQITDIDKSSDLNSNSTYKMNQINTIIINQNNKKDIIDLNITKKQESSIKNFLEYTTEIINKIKELSQLEKNKDISNENNKFYNFTPIQNELEYCLFYKINNMKKMMEKMNTLLIKIEIYLNQSLDKIIVIQNAFQKEINIPEYTTQDFIIELLAKSLIQYKNNKKYKKKILIDLKNQDTKFKSLINQFKIFIKKIEEKYKNAKTDTNSNYIINKLYNIINQYQTYSLALNVCLNNLSALLGRQQDLLTQKKVLISEIKPSKKFKKNPKATRGKRENKSFIKGKQEE